MISRSRSLTALSWSVGHVVSPPCHDEQALSYRSPPEGPFLSLPIPPWVLLVCFTYECFCIRVHLYSRISLTLAKEQGFVSIICWYELLCTWFIGDNGCSQPMLRLPLCWSQPTALHAACPMQNQPALRPPARATRSFSGTLSPTIES